MNYWIFEEMHFNFKKYPRIYTADFETSTPEWFDKQYQKSHYNIDTPDEDEIARIWAWDICSLSDYSHKTGTNMLSFMLRLSKLENNSLVCFHNLAFDGTYILAWLLEQGFECINEGRPRQFQFTTCISDMGQHYCYEICFKGNHIFIMDSLKYINKSVRAIAELYNLPIKKGECDYARYRFIDEPISDEDLSYIHNDTEVMARAIVLNLQNGMTRFTQAGNAKAEFKATFTKGDYSLYFPELSVEEDKALRKAYNGGFTYCNPKYRNKDLTKLISLDYNSMYPSQMLFMPMPYGYPEYGDGNYFDCKHLHDLGYDVFIQTIRCGFELKPNSIPMIMRKLLFAGTNSYISSSEGKIYTLTLASPDLELFFDNYDVYDLEYVRFAAFRSKHGLYIDEETAASMSKEEIITASGQGSLYYDYFLKWRRIKENSKGTQRAIAKTMQNALYGAEACNPIRNSQVPYLKEDGVLGYKIITGSEAQPMYLPAAIFTTAWSRYAIIKAIKANIDRFVYCDTDSLYLLGQHIPDNIPIHDTLYGHFKVEHYIEKARFLGAKRYIYYGRSTDEGAENEWNIACCGANDAVKTHMNWDNFHYGNVFEGKLSMKTIKGGKHLVNTTYKLTDD